MYTVDDIREQDVLPIGIVKACFDEATLSDYRFHMGAVIFKGSRIISRAHNGIRSVKCSPYIDNNFRKWNNSLHAELGSILKVRDKELLKGANILILRVSSTLQYLNMAFPCENCLSCLEYYRLKGIYYSDVDGLVKCYKI